MKVLLINGSPKAKGNTTIALDLVAEALEEEGIETDHIRVPKDPVQGCRGCGVCRTNDKGRCTFDGDIVNEILDKMENADALVLGSPVYYAAPNGQLLSVLDRVFFAGSVSEVFAGKPGAAVCAARRAGTTATLEVLQKYFTISGMPIVPSTYWPMIHGMAPGEAVHDAEGVQVMQVVGKNLAWMLKCFEAGKEAGIIYPKVAEKVRMNFIR